MAVKEVLVQVKSVLEVVDKWDDSAIAVIKSIAGLSFAPTWLKTLSFMLEKYEALIIEKGKTTIDYLISLLGGMEKAQTVAETKTYTTKEEKKADKLSVALNEVKDFIKTEDTPKEKEDSVIEKIGDATEKISGIISVIKGLF